MKIKNLKKNRKGAKSQERAVLEMLLDLEIDAAYEGEDDKYKYDLALFRFDNCREQGYMLLDRTTGLVMIWYEHRNSDNICVASMRTPKMSVTTDDFWEWLDAEKPDAGKYDMYDKDFGYGEIGDVAHYIADQIEQEY